MSFSSESGYTPQTIDEIMEGFREDINTQFGTAYTTESFIGTNHYKYFYAGAQRFLAGEIKTSEIFLYLQQYIAVTNERIQRPVATAPGLVEAFAAEGWTASVKPPLEADAGKIYVCVDVDDSDPDYEDMQLEINTIISQSVAAGVVSMGTETDAIVLDNGQSFDFKFNLPDRVEVDLKLTLTLSENNQVVVGNPDDVKQLLIDHIEARYSLGKNFEPAKYFTTDDAPWTSKVLLEYDIGGGFISTIHDAAYDDLFEVLLENITLVEA